MRKIVIFLLILGLYNNIYYRSASAQDIQNEYDSNENLHPSIMYAQGIVELESDNQENGIQLLTSSCEAGYTTACLHLSSIYEQNENYDEAVNFLESAINSMENTNDIYRYQLAMLQLKQQNYSWAMQNFNQINDAGEVNLELGITLYFMNSFSDSEQYFRQAVTSEHGKRKAIALLYLASVLSQLGKNETALRIADQARTFSSSYPELIVEAQRVFDLLFEATAPLPVLLSGSLSLSFGYDTNPTFAQLEAPSHTQSPRFWFRGSLIVEPWGNQYATIGNRLTLGRDLSIVEEARPFDITSINNLLYLKTRFWLNMLNEILIGYKYNLNMLDGGDLTEETYPYIFNEDHGGQIVWSLWETEWLATRIGFNISGKFYHNMGRDGVQYFGSAGQSIFLLDKKLKFFGDISFTFYDAQNSSYSYYSPRFQLSASYLTPLSNVEIVSSFSLLFADYFDSSGFFDPLQANVSRQDLSTIFSITLQRSFWNHWVSGITYRLIDSESSVDTFNYMQHVVFFTIEGRF